jgi:acetyl-CoA synthetase
MNGGTTVLFESTPTYPDPGRYWETVERLKINQFYGAPTAIRLLIKVTESWMLSIFLMLQHNFETVC